MNSCLDEEVDNNEQRTATSIDVDRKNSFLRHFIHKFLMKRNDFD